MGGVSIQCFWADERDAIRGLSQVLYICNKADEARRRRGLAKNHSLQSGNQTLTIKLLSVYLCIDCTTIQTTIPAGMVGWMNRIPLQLHRDLHNSLRQCRTKCGKSKK